MKLTESTIKLLRSIHWRANTYNIFWLSRYEYKKFWLTERTLRAIISYLKANHYIEHVDTEHYVHFWEPRRRYLYVATEKLMDLVKSFTTSIENMNEKIVNWCKKQNPVSILRDFGITVNNSGRIWGKESKITINRRSWAITNWKEWKTYNLYNYLREHLQCTHQYFFKHFIW